MRFAHKNSRQRIYGKRSPKNQVRGRNRTVIYCCSNAWFPHQQTGMSANKILIVEDEQAIREYFGGHSG